MAGDLGFRAAVVADATAAHEHRSYDGTHYSAEMVHNVALANLNEEFATVLNTVSSA